MTKKSEHPQPRNAYEAAQKLYAELQARLMALEGAKQAIKELEELWTLWELCIPDNAKVKENAPKE